MVKVAGVRFKSAGKVYYFDPGDMDLKVGDNIVAETARGLEFGTVSIAPKEVSDDEIVAPLKRIIRIADEKDVVQHEENLKKKQTAMAICKEKVAKHGLEMKLIDVEYTFDNSKVIFYFTADGRVDFRELVKDLASVFRMRIELRQIGVRDEAKMLGSIGMCGKGLCCNSWLSDFQPVSIKMAKVQNLSLNPTKISGICGRLMCCLKYENDIYNELKKGMPDNGERIKTPDGLAVVVETNILENKIKTRLITYEEVEEKAGDRNGQKGRNRKDSGNQKDAGAKDSGNNGDASGSKGGKDQQNGRRNGKGGAETTGRTITVEKFSTEFYYYRKEDITRLGNGKHKEKSLLEDVKPEYLDEIKHLMNE